MGIAEATDLDKSNGIYVLIQSSDGTVTKVLQETEQQVLNNDNLSTTAIYKPDKRLIIRESRHVPPRKNLATKDSPKEVRSILRTPPSRRNSGHHRRSVSLPTSFLSSSILSPVFDYFNTTSLDYPRRDVPTNQKNVRFSLPDDEEGEKECAAAVDDIEEARCRLSCLFGDDVPKKTHRRTQAQICMQEVIFELDVNDFLFFSNEEGSRVQVPTLISFKTRNDNSCHGQHLPDPPTSPKHHNSPHHHRRSRQYSFTV